MIAADIEALELVKLKILEVASQRVGSTGLAGPQYQHQLSHTLSSASSYELYSGGALDFQRIWALLIGINAYLDIPLAGALSDVSAFKGYLVSVLHVPQDRIWTLEDWAATRDQIMHTLYEFLVTNPRIRKGDALIIYFSGHGTSYDPSDLGISTDQFVSSHHGFSPRPEEHMGFWESDNGRRVQALAPVDRGPGVPDITGRELNVCLADMRNAKGSNITVFLDCCFSGGATREVVKGSECGYAGGRIVDVQGSRAHVEPRS